jgi:hypothetical protein
MVEAERTWTAKRGRKASQTSLYEWLDYQGKLTAQRLSDKHVVLYNAAGTNASAVNVPISDLRLPLVAEHKVYRGAVDSAEEADYLASMLNSTVVNEAIKPFQSMGLMGERDIEKKLMDLPLPQFKPQDSRHQELVQLGRRARDKAQQLLKAAELPASLARQRTWMRNQLAHELNEIDRVVKKLL